MSTKNIFSRTIFLVLFLAYASTLLAQDTEFWFVAPDISEQEGCGPFDSPMVFAISNATETEGSVTITFYNNGTLISRTETVPAGGLCKFDITKSTSGQLVRGNVENPRGSAGQVTKYGIHISSTVPVTIYYQVLAPCNQDIFSLKGSNALGTDFYVPMVHDSYYHTGPSYNPIPYDQIDIVAIEDGTDVYVTPTKAIRIGASGSAPADVEKKWTLNKGETLKIMEHESGRTIGATTLGGTKIRATKKIAVTTSEDLIGRTGGGTGWDVIGDQIVPVTALGNNYVVIKGFLAGSDRAYIVATQDGTVVTVNNGSTTYDIPLNAGKCGVADLGTGGNANTAPQAISITSNKPIYCYHVSGVRYSGDELGSGLLPSIYSIGQKQLSFYQYYQPGETHYAFVVFRDGAHDKFSIKYGTGSFQAVTATPITIPGMSDWKAAKIQILTTSQSRIITLKNSDSPFSFGFFSLNSSSGGSSYGYLSAFGDFKFPETTYKCKDQPVTLYAGYAKSYRWWKGRKTDVAPTIIGTGSSYTVPANEEGYYSVEIDTDPQKVISETYVKNDILNLTTTIPEYAKVNENTSFSATVTRPEGKTFEWTFTDATPSTGSGATVNDIKWTATGSKAVKLTVKNTELGCPDEVANKTTYVYDIQDDYASTTKNKAVKVDVLANDDFPILTATVGGIAINPHNGSATISDNKITYTPNNDFIGYDSLQYKVTYGTHSAYAWLRLSVSEEPDNISNAECFDDPLGIDFTFKLLSSSSTTYSVNNYNIPIAGDIDNDGYTEIIVGRTSISGVSTNQLYIFKFKDNKLEHQQTLNTPYFNNVANPYAIAKVDDNDYAAIFLCTDHIKNTTANQRKLIKYVYNSTTKLYEEFKVSGAEKRGTYSALSTKEMAQPMIVDFNGDGIPEVATYDKVFNARTMELLVDGNYLKDADKTDNTATGFGFGGHMNNNQTSQGASIMAIGDMDGDGVPEVVGGNCVYKVKIANPNGTAGNSFTLWSKCSKLGPNNEIHNEAVDGATAIADMDGDGLLDIIVTNGRFRNPTGKGGLYIWNPRTGKVIHTDIINSLPIYSDNLWAYGVSVAFIGDIDNADEKNQPEICFTGYMKSYAYQYDPQTKRLTQKWVINTNDNSGATTMVMFDFDQDGDNELVYRDTQSLRILDGKTGANKIPVTTCTSGTAIEYPIVADINGDGAAEIIVTGGTQLHVYASSPVGTWAPARKVWNQFAYNSVNINEDLTVPKVQFNPATTLTGGSCGAVRPYNGYLLQQTTLNKLGCPLFLLPNINFNGNPSYSYHTKGDSLLINVKFKNDGDAAIGPPVHISVYKNDVLPANFMATASKNVVVLPNQTEECTIKIENISSFEPYEKLVIRLNDNGSGTPVQQECDYGNNSGFKPHNQMLIAVNDTLAIPTNSTGKSIDVLTNDQLAGCTVSTIGIDIVSAKMPTRGTASINSDKEINFIPTPSYVGADSLQYEIVCGSDKATAELYIVIQALLKVERVNDAAEPSKKGKCKISFVEAGASYHKPLVVTYEITGGSAIHGTDYTDAITGTVTIPEHTNSKEFDVALPYNNYKVEGDSRTVEIKITNVVII